MQFEPGVSQLTPRLLSALETKYDKLLSNLAFNCNLRPSTEAGLPEGMYNLGGAVQVDLALTPL